jgi:hypothetical protein
MTRKIIRNKKKTKKTRIIKNYRKTMKGGAFMAVQATKSVLDGLITMFQYGLVSIITAPIYLISLVANLPLNTPNNISGKRLNEVKSGVIHNQLYKYLFYGYSTKDLKESDYTFPKNSKYKLQGNKVFVECDDCKEKKQQDSLNLPGGLMTSALKTAALKKLTGGGIDIKGNAKKILGVSSITDILGLLSQKEKMQSILSDFFDYINNLPMKDTERRDLIHKLILSINNKDAIIKCIIVFNTIFDDGECFNMKREIDDNANKPGSTFLEKPTISRIPNPFMIPGEVEKDLKKGMKCMTAHLMYKEFGPETLTQDCFPKCPKCTLRSSIERLVSTYSSSIKQLLKGTNKDLDLLSELFYNIFNQNYSYPGNTREIKIEEIKNKFIKSLISLPDYSQFNTWKNYPKTVDIKKINDIVIDSKFIINQNSLIFPIVQGTIKDESKKKDIFKKIYGEEVIEKFKKLLCRYNIIDELKKRYVSLTFENYYSLTENIIKYPNEESYKDAYLTWCNKFLMELYKIHGVDNPTVEQKFLFGKNELDKLILNSNNPLVNSFKAR